jgi:Fe-S cluster assembly ATP-binding protein
MLELKNITFDVTGDDKKKKRIIDDVTLKLDENKFYVITGPNGSGKSTLAKLIMGIETPTSGNILLNGQDITGLDITERAKLGISFALQQPVRFKGIQVLDLLKMAAKNNESFKDKSLSTGEACEYLSAVGLCAREYINREVNSSLSGGELKRIEIATVLARGTKVTLFDEPEAGIDLWSFQNLISVFEDMRKSIKGTVVIISHQERILNIADEIILLADGKIKKIGKKEDMLIDILGAGVASGAFCGKIQPTDKDKGAC